MMRLMFPECRRDVIAAEGWFWFHRAKMAHLVPFETGCLQSRRAGIPDLPVEQAKEIPSFFFDTAENMRNLLKKSTQHKDRQSTRRSGHHSAKTCVTQHIVRGKSGTVHASRGRTFQERLCKGSGCCTTQHALPTAEPRRTNTASQG